MKNLLKFNKMNLLIKSHKYLFSQNKYFFPEVEEVIVKIVKDSPKCEI